MAPPANDCDSSVVGWEIPRLSHKNILAGEHVCASFEVNTLFNTLLKSSRNLQETNIHRQMTHFNTQEHPKYSFCPRMCDKRIAVHIDI